MRSIGSLEGPPVAPTAPAAPDATPSPPREATSGRAALGLLVLAGLCWGLATTLSKVALEQVAPTDLLGVVVGSATVVLGGLALARGARPGRPAAAVLLLGIFEPGLSFVLFDLGIAHTTASHAALLLATDSLFTVVLAVWLLGEAVTAGLATALAIGTIGTVLVAWQSGGGEGSLAGDGLVLASSLAAAAYAILARRTSDGGDSISVTAVQMLGALIVVIPAVVIAGATGHSHVGHVDAAHWADIAAVAVLSIVPFLLFNVAIARVPAARAGVVLSLIPVFGALTAVVLLGDAIGMLQLAGGAAVVAAAAVAGQHDA